MLAIELCDKTTLNGLITPHNPFDRPEEEPEPTDVREDAEFLFPHVPPEERKDKAGSVSMSVASSEPVTFPSDISVIEDGEEDLPANEFFQIVSEERQRLLAQGGKIIRWPVLLAQLQERHPYFQRHTRNQIRDRYKYIKRILSKK